METACSTAVRVGSEPHEAVLWLFHQTSLRGYQFDCEPLALARSACYYLRRGVGWAVTCHPSRHASPLYDRRRCCAQRHIVTRCRLPMGGTHVAGTSTSTSQGHRSGFKYLKSEKNDHDRLPTASKPLQVLWTVALGLFLRLLTALACS